jgi:[glutamine synthetase] adenylyltransferase / [glutamine synthetase]-adenylyl-L-tyrosine phosphorylase
LNASPSREAWVSYYRPGGAALDYERQSLIRMRLVHGDAELGRELLEERDRITYSDPPLPIDATLDLFAKQAARKQKQGLWNAKYSPGGLAELEYGVQFLQLRHGVPATRIPKHAEGRPNIVD